jgi:hypothetical protein
VRNAQQQDLELVQRQQTRRRGGGLLGRLINDGAVKRNPLQEVAPYAVAVDRISEHRIKLETATEPKEASLLLDEMSRAIDEARRALWVREQAKKKDK